MKIRELVKKPLRGWLPKEPLLKITQKADSPLANIPKGKITQKHIAIANGLLLGAFLGTHFLIDPFNRSISVTIGFWSTFVPAMILLNYLLYQISKNRTTHKGAN
jgi:hypothetical protein